MKNWDVTHNATTTISIRGSDNLTLQLRIGQVLHDRLDQGQSLLTCVNAPKISTFTISIHLEKQKVCTMTDTIEYEKARKRAEAKYSFFVHAGIYAALMALLIVINLVSSPQQVWFIWPLIGWGFAVALHGVRVFLLADKNLIIEAMTENELRQTSAGRKFGRQ